MKTQIFVTATAALLLTMWTGCGSNDAAKNDDKVIKFSTCSIKVYEDTTKALAAEVEKLGYKLSYVSVADLTQQNEALEKGDIFANYGQHEPYMNEFNNAHKANLAAAFPVFTDRSGLFSKKYKSIKDLPEGAKITVDNNPGNGYRAIVLLADAGLIKIREGAKLDPTLSQKDIIDNPKKIQILEVDYMMLSKVFAEADAGFLYATVAAELGLIFDKDVLQAERKEYWAPDIITIHKNNVGSEKAKVLQKAYQTDAVKQALKAAFGGEEVLLPAW